MQVAPPTCGPHLGRARCHTLHGVCRPAARLCDSLVARPLGDRVTDRDVCSPRTGSRGSAFRPLSPQGIAVQAGHVRRPRLC
eukprot:365412-Chlamydomonas_euryale.AAC.14